MNADIDLTITPVDQKHRLVYDKLKKLGEGDSLRIKSLQDLVVLQSHIVDELGDEFLWEHNTIDDELYELVITRK